MYFVQWIFQQLTGINLKSMNNYYLHFPVNIVGDVIIQQFTFLLSVEGRDERFRSFQPLKQLLDVFLHSFSTSYPLLLSFCQSLLLLSHGEATVERGFSVNGGGNV